MDAFAHLTKGLELLATLPDTPACRRQELALQTSLCPGLVATKGFTASDRVWRLEGLEREGRACHLTQQATSTHTAWHHMDVHMALEWQGGGRS
jgi:hypothetical protein